MKRLSILALILGFAFISSLSAQQLSKLAASDGLQSDNFGNDVAMSGNYAVCGAAWADPNGPESGAAYVFHYDGTNWLETQKLMPSDGMSPQAFGYHVDISGDFILIGAYRDNTSGNESGAAYIFQLVGTTWTQVAKLTASDASADDRFGFSVSMEGDYALIGAPQAGAGGGTLGGAAYLFHRTGNNWNEVHKFSDPNGYRYGQSVEIAYPHVAIGSVYDPVSGALFAYQHNGTSWNSTGKYQASNGSIFDFFGASIDIENNQMVVGAYSEDQIHTGSGAAYFFTFNGSTWTETQKIKASDAAQDAGFGHSVQLEGNYWIVGAGNDSGNGLQNGAVYAFYHNGTSWVEETKLLQTNPAIVERMGVSIAISGTMVLAGADGATGNIWGEGAAYVFELNPVLNTHLETELETPTAISSLQVSPNPANQYIQLDYPLSSDAQLEILMLDSSGTICQQLYPRTHTQMGAFQATYTVAHLPAGFYTLLLKENGKQTHRKLMIQ